MAGSTNFQQWNPSQTNQETDSAYTADAARSGGVVDGEVFNAETANKLFYQTTTFPAAFAQALADKGFVVSDADFNQLVEVLSNIQTTADIKAALLVMPYGPTLTFDCSRANGFQVTLTGDVTSSTVINGTPGQIVTFQIIQDGVGNRNFAWPSTMAGTAPISGTAGITNDQSYLVRSDGSLHALTPLLSN